MMGFGKRGKKAEAKPVEVPAADLEVPIEQVQPQKDYVGMPGFVQDKPEPVAQPAPAIQTYEPVTPGIPTPTSPPASPIAAANQPQPVVPEQPVQPQPVVPTPVAPTQPVQPDMYRVVGAEEVQEGIYRYILITNKNLGEIGKEYQI